MRLHKSLVRRSLYRNAQHLTRAPINKGSGKTFSSYRDTCTIERIDQPGRPPPFHLRCARSSSCRLFAPSELRRRQKIHILPRCQDTWQALYYQQFSVISRTSPLKPIVDKRVSRRISRTVCLYEASRALNVAALCLTIVLSGDSRIHRHRIELSSDALVTSAVTVNTVPTEASRWLPDTRSRTRCH